MTRKKLLVRISSLLVPGLGTHCSHMLDSVLRRKSGHVPGKPHLPTSPVSGGASMGHSFGRSISALLPAIFNSHQIQLRAEDLYDKDKVDLETIVVNDVFKLLHCTDAGRDTAETLCRLELFGPNKSGKQDDSL